MHIYIYICEPPWRRLPVTPSCRGTGNNTYDKKK